MRGCRPQNARFASQKSSLRPWQLAAAVDECGSVRSALRRRRFYLGARTAISTRARGCPGRERPGPTRLPRGHEPGTRAWSRDSRPVSRAAPVQGSLRRVFRGSRARGCFGTFASPRGLPLALVSCRRNQGLEPPGFTGPFNLCGGHESKSNTNSNSNLFGRQEHSIGLNGLNGC